MAENPALPLWTDALLGDTQHLSQAEFGAYMLMLVVAWRSKDCCLPDDDKYLAKITRSGANWKRTKPVLMAFWRRGQDGQLRQKRLSYEHLAVSEMRKQQSEAGKSSARKRKERLLATVEGSLQREPNGKSTPISIPIPNNNQTLPQPSSSPSDPPGPVRPSAAVVDAAKVVRSADRPMIEVAGELANWATEFLSIATPIAAAPFIAWIQAGATPELIRGTIQDVMRQKGAGWKPNGINYFGKAIMRVAAEALNVTAQAGRGQDRRNGQVPMALQSKDQIDEVERINAKFIADGSYQSDVSLSQVKVMIAKGLLSPEAARKAGYAA